MAEQRHANEIETKNWTGARLEIAIPRMWLSGRVTVTGTVRTLLHHHASRPSASVNDSVNASRIGVCRRPDVSNENIHCPQLFTIPTSGRILPYLARQLSVQTLRHDTRSSEKVHLDCAVTPGVMIRHLHHRHLLSGQPRRLVPKTANENVIARHRRHDDGVARFTRRLRTNNKAYPCVAIHRPR